MSPSSPPAGPSPWRLALSIALIYAALATGWIIYSDRLLGVWVHDPQRITELQTWKGMFFVLSTSVLLGLMIRYGYASMEGLQQRLAEREAGLRVALRATRLGLWDYHASRDEVCTDEAVARMLGYPPEGFRDSVAAWVERLHPDDREQARMRFRNYLDGLTRDYVGDYRMRVADGSWRWFRAAGEIVERDAGGRPLRVIGTYLDITDQVEAYRKLTESEARARLYLQRMPIGCVVTDTDWRIIECNPAFEEIFAYPAQAMLGRALGEIIIPPEARGQTDVVLARLRSGTFDSHNVNENITGDGRRILCEWFNTPIRDAEGEVVQLLAMAIDITARDATDRALAESYHHLADLSARLIQVQEEERGRLARELHDEIGQQLTAVKFNLHAIAREALGEAGRARLEDCVQIVERSIGQVRDRALDLRPSLLDDLGLGPALAWYCQSQAERSGVRVVLREVGGLPRLAGHCETAAFRIVQEAVNNALRHAAPSVVEVRLALDDGVLDIDVEDDGCGFEPERTASGRGSLGLVSMRERAELAGGRFELQTAAGQGVRIHARLPVVLRGEGG